MSYNESRSRDDDEIDLLDLLGDIWAERLLIACITLAITVCAALYAFLATPYYQVTSVLHPPLLKDLEELNGAGVYKITPEEALARVGSAVSSYENRLEFARLHEGELDFLTDADGSFEQEFERFNSEAFEIKQPDPKKANTLSPFIELSLTYPKDLDGARFTNDFISFAIDREREKLKGDFEAMVANQLAGLTRSINSYRASYEAEKDSQIATLLEEDALKTAQLKDELSALRQLLLTRRKDRIAALDENIAIARSLGIHKPTSPTSLGDSERGGGGNVIRTEVNNQEVPLYFMGTEALEAERLVLQKRRSDDFTEPRIAEIQQELHMLQTNRQVELLKKRENEDLFLKKLAESREEEARLKGLQVDLSSLKLVNIDRYASEPLNPVKPKKLLILAAGIILGGVLGVFVALLRSVLRKKKQPGDNSRPLSAV
ncbi:Wzz/FepE/Etk N-terminal domain-containing protein [Ectopseudomonas mendocina]|uniref:Wzz/FepE/Etk N-terminal domain-containing protein n=1 Tax=Ectopseudomonas mendocina TaxID=300 RepID=A0ABZ2RG44_ECTME